MKAIAVCAFLVFMGCQKTVQVPIVPLCDAQVSFAKKVKPIFTSNCALSGCHDGSDMPSLNEYLVVRDGATQIRKAVQYATMPPNRALSDSDKATIVCWIDSGTKDN